MALWLLHGILCLRPYFTKERTMKLAVSCFVVALCVMSLAGSSRAVAQTGSPLPDAPKPTERRSDRMDLLYRVSEGYLAEGTWFDGWTTSRALGHPTMAYRSNGVFLMRYVVTEGGWARCFGKRDAYTAVTANVLLNAATEELSRRLYRRGGRWRLAALGVNLYKATSSTLAGVHNLNVEAGIDQHIQNWTGYRGAIIWHP